MNITSLTRYEKSHFWYFTSFSAQEKKGYDTELIFKGLDCFADIYLNSQLIGSTSNMLIEHTIKINGQLKETNTLFVHFKPAEEEAKKYEYPPSNKALCDCHEATFVRKAPHMYGWDIMPRAVSGGIWRPVFIRFRPKERLETVFLDNTKLS